MLDRLERGAPCFVVAKMLDAHLKCFRSWHLRTDVLARLISDEADQPWFVHGGPCHDCWIITICDTYKAPKEWRETFLNHVWSHSDGGIRYPYSNLRPFVTSGKQRWKYEITIQHFKAFHNFWLNIFLSPATILCTHHISLPVSVFFRVTMSEKCP